MPPDKHIRKIAMMNNNVWYPNNPGPAGFLTMALRKIGCEVDQFASLDIPPDKEKYDDFIFVDDGDLQHWQCPEWAHPSKYWAVDMYNPSCFPYAPPEEYLKKASSFDEFYSISQSAVEFCIQNGVQAYHLPHAGNEDYHKPYPESKIWDWLCIWHNYNERADYSKAALEKFPNGFLSDDTWGDDYPIYTSRARCVINKVRGFEYNAKVVETMMIGVPLVTDRAKYLDTFFVENEHFRGHSSIEEMLEQVRWVLDHPTEASDMSERARLLVLKSHRYYHRALRMLSGW
jgi:spore maturation protein CgeB